jgi:hypothetical protein
MVGEVPAPERQRVGGGGAGVTKAVVRVTFWGALAFAMTAGIGKLFGTVV